MKNGSPKFIAVKYSKKRFGIGEPGGEAAYLLQCIDMDADNPIARSDALVMAAGHDLLAACQAVENAMPGAFKCVTQAIYFATRKLPRTQTGSAG